MINNFDKFVMQAISNENHYQYSMSNIKLEKSIKNISTKISYKVYVRLASDVINNTYWKVVNIRDDFNIYHHIHININKFLADIRMYNTIGLL